MNIGNFLSECILQQFGWIEERRLRTDFRLPEADIFVETNEHDLKRIFENLFSNVRKYVKSYVGVKVYFEKEKLAITVENDLEEPQTQDIRTVLQRTREEQRRERAGALYSGVSVKTAWNKNKRRV